MDFDPRDDRLGPIKLARTDALPLKMHLAAAANTSALLHTSSSSLIRSNSMASDCRLSGCSPTSTADGAAALLLGAEGMSHGGNSYLEEARFCLNRGVDAAAMASYMGNVQRYGGGAMAQAAAYPFRGTAAGGVGCYMGSMFHDGGGDPHSAAVFTASQLRELQLHALIFKHLMCGVNVPPELALPIRTSVAAMTAGAAHHLAATFGWGGYAMGYGNSLDPEPGRCRRTDGKKWRCSRDVVPDQKYCERHMHRGRHRTRKPPEPQFPSSTAAAAAANSGHNNTNLNNNNSNSNNNNNLNNLNPHHNDNLGNSNCTSSPTTNLSSSPATARSGGTATNSTSNSSLPRCAPHISSASSDLTCANFSPHQQRYMCSEQELYSDGGRRLGHESPSLSSLSAISSAVNNHDSMHIRSAMQASSKAGSAAHSFLAAAAAAAAYEGRESTSATPTEGQPLRHFFDDWPAGRGREATPTSSTLAWHEVEAEQQQRREAAAGQPPPPLRSGMQLSISIPEVVAAEQLGSNGSSPRGKLALSPLKLSMCGGGDADEAAAEHQRSSSDRPTSTSTSTSTAWVPIAWGSEHPAHSLGGPLAEVLHSSNNTPRGSGGGAPCGVVATGSSSSSSNNQHNSNSNNGGAAAASAALNLMAEAWAPDRRSPSQNTASAHFHHSPPPAPAVSNHHHHQHPQTTNSSSDLSPKP